MKTIIFDMYGVIIKECKGNFIHYTLNYFPKSEHERLTKAFKVDKLFTKAGNGEITSDEFLTALGFEDTQFHMHNYIENHLTLDESFYSFAESKISEYNYALLSNDVSEWSRYITDYYKLNKYFTTKIVSADVKCRKPNLKIYQIALDRIGLSANECIFIDNSVENLYAAESLGMDVILFNRDNEKFDGKTVYSFEELSRIV